MTDKTFQELLENPPEQVDWGSVVAFDQVDQRRMCVEMIHGTIIGVVNNAVEFAPNNNPASRDEILAWIWFIRPDLATDIQPNASKPLQALMEYYNNGNVDEWMEQFPI